MQLAIPFKLQNDHINDAATEFNIIFKKDRNSMEKLIEFAEAYPDKRINIEMDTIDTTILSVVNKVHDQIYARLSEVSHLEAIPALKEKNIKFFMDYKLFPAKNICDLSYLLSLGVTDIYPVDDLLYNIYDLHKILESHGVQARMVLNRLPYTLLDNENPRIPWFTPQNTDILDKFIDVAEFDVLNDPQGWKQFEVYYNTWFVRKHWHGNLREIIPELNFDIPNDSLFSSDLLNYKIHCGRHCVNKNSHCNRCENFIEIAKKLDEAYIGVNQE